MRKPVNVNDRRHLYAEYERCKRAADHFDYVRMCALNGLPELNALDREHVQTLIAWLEAAVAELRKMSPPRDGPPDPHKAQQRQEQCYAAQRAVHVATLTHAALTVYYGGDSECMALYTRTVLGSGTHFNFEIGGRRIEVEKVPVFSLALVESLLKETASWREKRDPLAYVAAVARRMAWDQAQDDAPLKEKGFVSLDDRTTPDISAVDVAPAPASSYSLEKVVANDPDLLQYARAREQPPAKHAAACRQLGWDSESSHAKSVQQRYLGWCRYFAERGESSAPSQTVFFEKLNEYEHGPEFGTYQFRRPRKPENS